MLASISPLALASPPPLSRSFLHPGAPLNHRQMATNFGDTLASELGILSSSPPRYILTGATVPAGTNGGVSPYGLVMSALGGSAIGAVMVVDLMIERSCWGHEWAVEMIVFGTAMGFLGSLVSCSN